MVRGGNTGLWPESPGYGFSPVLNILSWEQPLKRAGQPVEIVVTHMDGRKKHIPVFWGIAHMPLPYWGWSNSSLGSCSCKACPMIFQFTKSLLWRIGRPGMLLNELCHKLIVFAYSHYVRGRYCRHRSRGWCKCHCHCRDSIPANDISHGHPMDW